MGTTNESPDTTVEQQKPPSTTGTQTEDWERRFKGLQLSYDKLQKKYEESQTKVLELSAEIEETRASSKTHESERKSRDEKIQTLEAQVAESTKRISTHELERARMRLIMADYPELATFEAQGLLPQAENEEGLKTILENFRTTLVKSVDGNLKDKLKGAQPPLVSATETKQRRSAEEIYAKLVQLAGKNDTKSREEYNALQKEWDEINKD